MSADRNGEEPVVKKAKTDGIGGSAGRQSVLRKEHKLLHKLVGEWTATFMFKSGDCGPADPWQSTPATSTGRKVFDGRIVDMDFHMSFAGAPFEGYATLAFDVPRGVFQHCWRDSMGMGLYMEEGPFTNENEIHMEGVARPDDKDPSKKKETKSRFIFESEDKVVFDAYTKREGDGEFNNDMRIIYERKI